MVDWDGDPIAAFFVESDTKISFGRISMRKRKYPRLHERVSVGNLLAPRSLLEALSASD